ncbi:MAG: hypothetical protein NWF01_03780 [Candidatus Bathyarchaeota archaeon]|nr:hypothetical protein [Candidatus Bathyarchaeota archaeon]
MHDKIHLENGDHIIINKPSLTEEWYVVGEKVTITYPLEKANVCLYPPNELADETAV